jgi:hypothetical protein
MHNKDLWIIRQLTQMPDVDKNKTFVTLSATLTVITISCNFLRIGFKFITSEPSTNLILSLHSERKVNALYKSCLPSSCKTPVGEERIYL